MGSPSTIRPGSLEKAESSGRDESCESKTSESAERLTSTSSFNGPASRERERERELRASRREIAKSSERAGYSENLAREQRECTEQ